MSNKRRLQLLTQPSANQPVKRPKVREEDDDLVIIDADNKDVTGTANLGFKADGDKPKPMNFNDFIAKRKQQEVKKVSNEFCIALLIFSRIRTLT